MDLSDDKVLDKMYASVALLGEPAAGVVRELVDEVRRLRVLAANLRITVASIDPSTPREPTLGPWMKMPSTFKDRWRYVRYTTSPVCPVTAVVTVIDYRAVQDIALDATPGSDPTPWGFDIHSEQARGQRSEYFVTAEEAMTAADVTLVENGWILS